LQNNIYGKAGRIEVPRRKQRSAAGGFDRNDVCYFWIRSLTPPSRQGVTGNALVFAVQYARNKLAGRVLILTCLGI
jgi:hypothetical protein